MRATWLGCAALALAAPLMAQTAPPASGSLAPVRTDGNKVLITLPAPGADGVAARYLYVSTLRSGLGSAALGLDRAAFGPTQLIAFRQVGSKLVIQFENPRFRATNAPAAEQAAARDSFADAAAKWLTGEEAFVAKLHPEFAPFAEYDQLMRLEEWDGRDG